MKKPDETWAQLGLRLFRLHEQAYPDFTRSQLDRIAGAAFLRLLPDEWKRQLLDKTAEGQRESLFDYLKYARNFEVKHAYSAKSDEEQQSQRRGPGGGAAVPLQGDGPARRDSRPSEEPAFVPGANKSPRKTRKGNELEKTSRQDRSRSARACFKCGDPSHMARECPESSRSGDS